MSICNFTTQIDENLCIGDSLSIINSNFDTLDTTLCNLSSISTELINNLNIFSNTFSSNINNILSLLNTSVSSSTLFNTSILLYTAQLNIPPGYHPPVINYTINATFILPTGLLPNTAKFIMIRGDSLNKNDLSNILINGSSLPISTYQINDESSFAYLTLPILPTYNITGKYGTSYLPPAITGTVTILNVRILGYF